MDVCEVIKHPMKRGRQHFFREGRVKQVVTSVLNLSTNLVWITTRTLSFEDETNFRGVVM